LEKFIAVSLKKGVLMPQQQNLPEQNQLITLDGTVEDVIYENPENGYAVFSLELENEILDVTGNFGKLGAGERISVTGNYIMSAKYGRQFKAVNFERKLPETKKEILKYLTSGAVKGLKPNIAQRLVDTFGEDTLNALKQPEKITAEAGVSLDVALAISQRYRKNSGMNETIDFLKKYGVDAATAVNVWNLYGIAGISVVKENPYKLCAGEIALPLEQADKIAEEFKIKDKDLSRAAAAIFHSLRSLSAEFGHTCISREILHQYVCETLETDGDSFEISLDNLLESKSLISVTETPDNTERIFLPEYYKAELYSCKKIAEMLKLSYANIEDYTKEISEIEQEEGIEYHSLQKSAIHGSLENNLFILTGGPGTGKTTTLNAVIKILKRKRKRIVLAAPTGRAAKRMSELTGEEAKTIHRLLEVDASSDKLQTFKRNEENPVKADAIIIDEMSMVDSVLFEALLRAVPLDCKLIMVGDSNQLPSVGAGNVLHDLLTSSVIPFTELTEIFRQAQQSLIVTNAHKIISGKMPALNEKKSDFFFMERNSDSETARLVCDLISTRLPAAYNYSPFEDIQVLCLTRIGDAGTIEMNNTLQRTLNPPSMTKREIRFGNRTFREGDKVIQNTNDYNVKWKKDGEGGMGIFNGDLGIVSEINNNSGYVIINFDGRAAKYNTQDLDKVELAYAITIHKSQGSEYNAVIMPLSFSMKRMLFRNLLYTGVTRAKEKLVVVGSSPTIEKMVNTNKQTSRSTSMQYFLRKLQDA
jgi:exodeoxyribonuclease V alpha subunit